MNRYVLFFQRFAQRFGAVGDMQLFINAMDMLAHRTNGNI
jgi:hypothetical protein